jgi:hypothetical protein
MMSRIINLLRLNKKPNSNTKNLVYKMDHSHNLRLRLMVNMDNYILSLKNRISRI